MSEESHLFQEIHQQPEALRELLAAEKSTARKLADAIQERNITHVVIAARGTSDNAGRYAKYLLGASNGLTVALATPSLFTVYRQPPQFRDALVLGISQSGESPDIVMVMEEARRQGALTAGITNFPDSDLGTIVEHTITLHAGVEHSIAATKTYTTELAAVALLSGHLVGDEEKLHALDDIPQKVEQCLALNKEIAAVAPRYRYMNHCIVIGRGFNYATAYELALKLKELTYIVAEPYSSADFMHGPVALIEDGFPAIIVAPSGALLTELLEFVETLRKRGAELMVISDNENILSRAHIPIKLPGSTPEWLSPLVAIIPGQLFAMHLTHARGYDPDHPRGLRKVTETR